MYPHPVKEQQYEAHISVCPRHKINACKKQKTGKNEYSDYTGS